LSKWLILCALPLLTSLILSRLVIHYFGRRLLDRPNNRSSHQIPTPRGGGIALALGVIISILTGWSFGHINTAPLYWLLIPSGLITILGICDDLFNLKIGARLAMQFLLSGVGLFFIGSQSELSQSTQVLIAGPVLVFIVWMTNLYNFMDGINGLAALQAISVCMSMAFIYWILSTNTNTIYLLIIITASSLGFLCWNFPIAKLFMGDSGSLFLGLSFGLLTIEGINEGAHLATAWLIMLGVFIVDASYTLFYRLFTRQAFHQAHRTHAYQKIAIKYKSHTYATLAIVTINLVWLFPIAIAAATKQLNYIAALIIAYTPLLWLARKFHAGRIDQSTHK
jgi:Fuc2NAc and GlcNAc transferase